MGIETRTREVEVCHKNSIPNPNPNPISSPNLYQEGRDLGGIEVIEWRAKSIGQDQEERTKKPKT